MMIIGLNMKMIIDGVEIDQIEYRVLVYIPYGSYNILDLEVKGSPVQDENKVEIKNNIIIRNNQYKLGGNYAITKANKLGSFDTFIDSYIIKDNRFLL